MQLVWLRPVGKTPAPYIALNFMLTEEKFEKWDELPSKPLNFAEIGKGKE